MLARRMALSVFGVCISGAVILCSMALISPLEAEASSSVNTGYLFDTPVMTGISGNLVLDHNYDYSLKAKASSQVEGLLRSGANANWSWLVAIRNEAGISPSDINMSVSILNGTARMSGEINWYSENETTIIGLGNFVPVPIVYHPGSSAPDPGSVSLDATMNGTLAFHANGNYSVTATVVSLEGSNVTAVSPSGAFGGPASPLVNSIGNATPPTFSAMGQESSAAVPPASCQPGASCSNSTPFVKCCDFFTNLSVNGYWPLESSGQSISLSSSGQMVGQPVGGLNCNTSGKVSSLMVGQAYYFWLDAVTQQAYVDYLKANGFNHSNVWGRGCLNQNFPLADWLLMVSAPGISSNDVIMNAGYGWPSQANAMAWKPFAQGVNNESACVESVPSYYSMSVGHWAMGQWTDSDVIPADFPALTPAAIQFQKPGIYTLSFFLVNGKNGSLVSQMVNTTVNVEGTAAMGNCAKPWPSTLEIIDAPKSLKPGQTYVLQARMLVQNFETNCTSSPWFFATNTPIIWTITGVDTRTSPTDGNGVSAVQFVAPSGSEVTVTASWVGNREFQAANASVDIPISA